MLLTWGTSPGTTARAALPTLYLGTFPEFQQIVKAANPNYRLRQRAPENILEQLEQRARLGGAGGVRRI
ncbi:MAG: hypothetical protein ACLRI7_10290 [Ruthenibacterium lactatiformans]